MFGNVDHKLAGVLVLAIILKHLSWTFQTIGFKDNPTRGILLGLGLSLFCFAIGYGIEIALLKYKNGNASFSFFFSGDNAVSSIAFNYSIILIILSVIFNLLNAFMEEGIFRGLFINLIKRDDITRFSLLFSAFLFGIWHIVAPIISLVYGQITVSNFLLYSVAYVIFSGVMGFKWGMMYELTGNLWSGFADHMFNYLVATNLLHVISKSKVDELYYFRILIAQTISLFIVGYFFRKNKGQKRDA